jgi:pyridoxamine 5'-phosphate oxidase
MPNRDLNNMRESYESALLLEENCDSNPFVQFDKWFQNALDNNLIEPNAMQIATVGKDLQPSVRTVLLKSFDVNGFVFYTNYDSKKGIQIAENSKVSLLFWYREHERQIRIEGFASKTTYDANNIYFHSRPIDSQLAASISNQSKVIENRAVLDDLFNEKKIEYQDKEIPLRENWGGYIIVPHLFEFWQGRKSRLHDRIQYTKQTDATWKLERLAP